MKIPPQRSVPVRPGDLGRRAVPRAPRPSAPERVFTMMSWDTGDGMVLSLGGELDIAGVPDLLERVRALVAQRHPRIVVDVNHLTFCDCAGLRALLRAQQIAKEAGGWVRLSRIGQPLQRLIALTGLSQSLAGYPGAAAAFNES